MVTTGIPTRVSLLVVVCVNLTGMRCRQWRRLRHGWTSMSLQCTTVLVHAIATASRAIRLCWRRILSMICLWRRVRRLLDPSDATGLIQDDIAKAVAILAELWELAFRLAVVPIAIAVDNWRPRRLLNHTLDREQNARLSNFRRTLSSLVWPSNVLRSSARNSRRNAELERISRCPAPSISHTPVYNTN